MAGHWSRSSDDLPLSCCCDAACSRRAFLACCPAKSDGGAALAGALTCRRRRFRGIGIGVDRRARAVNRVLGSASASGREGGSIIEARLLLMSGRSCQLQV